MDAAERLRGLTQQTSPWRVMQVAAVGADGTVDLDYGSTVIERVPCLDGYHTRLAGDNVLVLQIPNLGWAVFGRLSAPPL